MPSEIAGILVPSAKGTHFETGEAAGMATKGNRSMAAISRQQRGLFSRRRKVHCMKMAKCAQYSTARTMHVWASPYKMYGATIHFVWVPIHLVDQ